MGSLRLEIVGLRELRAKVRRLLGNLDEIESLWAKLSEVMVEHEMQTFASGGFGTWPPLAPVTIRDKQRLGYPPDPMIRTGTLLGSLTDPVAAGRLDQTRDPAGRFAAGGRQAFVWQTGVEYAVYHQEGPEHNPDLPVRNVIIVTPGLLAEINRAADDWLAEQARESGFAT